jgi:hypothetical protein
VSPKVDVHSAKCDRSDARIWLTHAKKFLEVAEMVAIDEDAISASASVAAALAVLVGIAASVAACCASLERRSRGKDHRQAVALVQQVSPSGVEAAKHLDRLLVIKDTAHYGVIHVSSSEMKSTLRNAKSLVNFAEARLRR